MNEDRIHRVASEDGAEIAGRVPGEGPPLVLVHGGLGDGEDSWRFLLPFLVERFTCYLVSTRGRGLSPPHPDVSRERLVEDLVAFADSIGEPVGLMGHSSGATLALGAAADAERVSGLALYEPPLTELAPEDVLRRFEDASKRTRHANEEGRPADGAQVFFEDIALANDQELAMLAAANATQFVAANVPAVLEEIAQSGFPRLSDMDLLERVDMPVLLLEGSDTHPFYADIVRELDERLGDSRVREVAGAGHLGPLLAAEAVAEELARFFAETLPTA